MYSLQRHLVFKYHAKERERKRVKRVKSKKTANVGATNAHAIFEYL